MGNIPTSILITDLRQKPAAILRHGRDPRESVLTTQ